MRCKYMYRATRKRTIVSLQMSAVLKVCYLPHTIMVRRNEVKKQRDSEVSRQHELSFVSDPISTSMLIRQR